MFRHREMVWPDSCVPTYVRFSLGSEKVNYDYHALYNFIYVMSKVIDLIIATYNYAYNCVKRVHEM